MISTDATKIKDTPLRVFCTEKENCLRSCMIRALGDSAPGNPLCCMVCNPTQFADGTGGRLDVLQIGKTVRKKKRRAVWTVTAAQVATVKLKLEIERAKYIAKYPSLGILGVQMVCSDSIIKTICDSAKFISVVEDMDLFCLRQELKDCFFNVIVSVFNN